MWRPSFIFLMGFRTTGSAGTALPGERNSFALVLAVRLPVVEALVVRMCLCRPTVMTTAQ